MSETESIKDERKPSIEIDRDGNLSVWLPLLKVGEPFARGWIDIVRSQVLTFFANVARQQKELATAQAEIGKKSFLSKILRR